MLKKIVLAFLLIGMLAVPGSAWEYGFENHPTDLYSQGETLTDNELNFANSGTNQYISTTLRKSSTGIKYFTIDEGFTNILCFNCDVYDSVYQWETQPLCVYITCYDEDQILLNRQLVCSIPIAYGTIKHTRCEIVRTGLGDQFEVYNNENYIGGFELENASTMTSIKFETNFYASVDYNSWVSVKYDNFMADDDKGHISISTDLEHDLGTSPTISFGFDTLPDWDFLYKVFKSNGEVVQSGAVSTATSSVVLSSGNLTELGRYYVRLYQFTESNPDLSYLLGSQYFDIVSSTGDTDACSIEINKDEINPGETLSIFAHVSPYTSGYRVFLNYGGTKEFAVTAEDQTFFWTVPSDVDGNYIHCYLLDPSGNIKQYKFVKIIKSGNVPRIELDKDTYYNDEYIRVYYWYMPIGTKLSATYYLNGAKLDTSIVTINDVVSYSDFTIGGRDADSVFIEAYSSDAVYDSEYADILYGNYGLSGKVLDAITGAAVEDATVLTPSFTVFTDDDGYYEHTSVPGSLNVTISADGYETLHTNVYVNSVNTKKDFYITPLYVSDTGASFYGIITDYYTGAPLSGCNVRLTNGSISHYTISTSKGYYVFDSADLIGTWTIKVSKTGYDSHSKTVTLDGDTYYGVRLVPSDGAPDTVPDDDGTSPDGQSDRPSREAAKDSLTWLEETMPGLVKLAVLVFMLALVGWRF